jgi:hypothetical protein
MDILAAAYKKRCEKSWRRSAIKMDLKSELREKRENIIRLKVGRYNKMATGGDLSARRLLIESLHPALRLASDGILGRAQRRRDDKFSLKQKGSQIMLARPCPKMAAILPSIRSQRVTAS